MPLAFRLALLLSIFIVPRGSQGGGGPQNVALVVNPNDPASLEVANLYVELRGISEVNVIYIPWAVDSRATTGEKFNESLIKPVLAEMKRRGVTEQIDYLAFSSGFPYLIDCAPSYPGHTFPKPSRPITSLTSAAFLYQFMEEDRREMFEVPVNYYYAPTVGNVVQSRAFQGSQEWSQGREVASGGAKYLLSTALGVTHQRGNSVAEILECLRRAKQADGANYRGTIYYMQNNDVRSRARHDGFKAAVDALKAINVNAVILPGAAPRDQPDVAGLTTGTSHLHLRTSGSTLLPGALVDNLTSSGGKMHRGAEPNPQTCISEFIRLGAAGASGAVVEPYAIAAKFPSPALHVHYARGCSLAESFYQSVAAPYHLLIIGDPLCQPWALPPQVSVEGISDAAPLSRSVTMVPTAKYADARHASQFELYVNGVRTDSISPGESFELDTQVMADGWHTIRVVAIDNTPIAVQGAWDEVVQVKNGRDALQLTIDEPRRASVDGTLEVGAASTLPGPISIIHLGRTVGTVASGERTPVDLKAIGRGAITLRAEQGGTPPLRSRPVVIEIY